MKVILTRDVPNTGYAGDLKDVAAGYARNYLIPQGLAIKATPGAQKEYERRRAAEDRKHAKLAARATELAEQIKDVSLSFEAKAGETGRLYGSVTTAEIAEALSREVGVTFDRRKHIDSEPLREIGEHAVTVRLSADVTTEIKVVVTPEGGELPPPAAEATEPAEEAPAEDVPEEESAEDVPAEETPAEEV